MTHVVKFFNIATAESVSAEGRKLRLLFLEAMAALACAGCEACWNVRVWMVDPGWLGPGQRRAFAFCGAAACSTCCGHWVNACCWLCASALATSGRLPGWIRARRRGTIHPLTTYLHTHGGYAQHWSATKCAVLGFAGSCACVSNNATCDRRHARCMAFWVGQLCLRAGDHMALQLATTKCPIRGVRACRVVVALGMAGGAPVRD